MIEKLKARRQVSKLSDVIHLYRPTEGGRGIHGISDRSARNNILSMLKMLERVTGQPVDSGKVSLTKINQALAVKFQEWTVDIHYASAEKDNASQREARDRRMAIQP